MAFKNKKVELVRSFRKQITAEIPRAKISFYENKVGSNEKKKAQNLGGNTLKCLMGKKSVKVTIMDSSTWLQIDNKQSACYINNFLQT